MATLPANGKIALVTGVGPGTGAALARRFGMGGYRVAMFARDKARLDAIAAEMPGVLFPFVVDVADLAALEAALAHVRERLGAPSVVVHNAVSATFGDFMKITPDELERNFRVNTTVLLRLAQLTVPDMVAMGGGALIVTGNTSAYRGRPNFAGFAPTKASQRILLESIARNVGPQGVHAAYIAIDAVIDLAWTRNAYKDKPDEFFAKPVDIAEECFRVAHQPRSTWVFDVVIRPFGESW